LGGGGKNSGLQNWHPKNSKKGQESLITTKTPKNACNFVNFQKNKFGRNFCPFKNRFMTTPQQQKKGKTWHCQKFSSPK